MKACPLYPRMTGFILFFTGLAAFCLPLPAVCADPVKLEGESSSPASSTQGSTGMNYRPVQITHPGLNLPERESAFSPLPSAGWAAPYQTTANQKLIEVLWQSTAGKAGSLAKNVGQTLGDYVKEKQGEMKQQELVHRFYDELDQILVPMRLRQSDYVELLHRVEQVYIEDAESGAFKLDTVTFRDLPVVARKEYAEMALTRVQNGPVETFFANGAIKARWNFKNGKPDGAVTTYYEDGEIHYIDIYRDGMKIHRKKFDKEGKLEFEQAYDYSVPSEEPQSAPETPRSVQVSAPSEDAAPAAPKVQEPADEAPEHPL